MRAISLFAHLMSSAVSVQARTGHDGYGKPTYGSAVSYRAHLARRPRLVRTESGEEVVSALQVYLEAEQAISPTARITLSTGDVGSTSEQALHPPLIAVTHRFDQAGPHHVVLYLA